MKSEHKRHTNRAISPDITRPQQGFSGKSAIIKKASSQEDAETLIRLNLLAGKLPFCSWHRQKDNDPL